MNSASGRENRSSRITALRHAVSRNALPSVLEFSKRGIHAGGKQFSNYTDSRPWDWDSGETASSPSRTLQGKVGNASDTDPWRHYMLHIAGAGPLPDTSRLQGDFLVTVTTRSKSLSRRSRNRPGRSLRRRSRTIEARNLAR